MFTDNYYVVKIIGTIVWQLFLALSLIYLCHLLKIKSYYTLLFSILGGLSIDYYFFVIEGMSYINVILAIVMVLALLIDVVSYNGNIIKKLY